MKKTRPDGVVGLPRVPDLEDPDSVDDLEEADEGLAEPLGHPPLEVPRGRHVAVRLGDVPGRELRDEGLADLRGRGVDLGIGLPGRDHWHEAGDVPGVELQEVAQGSTDRHDVVASMVVQ